MPALVLNGRRFVGFAGWKRHVSLYPIPAVEPALDRQLQPYKSGRGTLRFPLDKPLPLDLIAQAAAALAADVPDSPD
jgi:uncharacterized protein YdhG (YjbR/CyaY superfamily)